MQIERRTAMTGRNDFKIRPEVRNFAPKAASPCLQEARQHVKDSSVMAWKGNCGCTCLCPTPPKLK